MPVALAVQATLLALIVPLADPAICMLPKQVAPNVPEPVLPVNDVTAQREVRARLRAERAGHM